MNKEDYCVGKEYTIKEAMQVFDRNRERGLVVLGEEGKICGFLSMGDIIFALLDGKNMYSQVGQICNPSFIYLYDKNYQEAFEIFKKRNVSWLPIVDKKMHLVDVITAREMFGKLELKQE